MYNFRYHLITIVAIFAALALGLLLGVAITGSDLVRDASSNLAESLTDQFDELREQNEELSAQIEVERLLETQLITDWQAGRLEGRVVIVLTTADEAGETLARELGSLIEKGGGVPVFVAVYPINGFGLADATEQNFLKSILPEVEGEDYEATLAEALAKEWTELTPGGAASTRNTFEAAYPLTGRLVRTNRITISVDYQPLLDELANEDTDGITDPPADGGVDTSVSPDTPAEGEDVETSEALPLEAQRTSLSFAQQLGLPYAANGLIDAVLLSAPESTQLRVDGLALQLALAFEARGAAGELPYLLEVQSQDAQAEAVADSSPVVEGSYFSLLVAAGDQADLMRRASEDSGLSCVLNPFDLPGHYSMIALLSGADKGIYAFYLSGVPDFPPLPLDGIGNAAFAGRNQASPASL